jgi:hypothetical protein
MLATCRRVNRQLRRTGRNTVSFILVVLLQPWVNQTIGHGCAFKAGLCSMCGKSVSDLVVAMDSAFRVLNGSGIADPRHKGLCHVQQIGHLSIRVQKDRWAEEVGPGHERTLRSRFMRAYPCDVRARYHRMITE